MKSDLEEYAEMQGIDWKWQGADGAITKSPLGGQATGANPTDRGQCGTKRSVLVEAKDVPIAIEVGPAQRH
jgi:putative transposase